MPSATGLASCWAVKWLSRWGIAESRLGKQFDANNTEEPTANAQTGAIPAYLAADFSATRKLSREVLYRLSSGMNSVLDARYFTHRAGGYPGPGILTANGRTWFAGLGLTL